MLKEFRYGFRVLSMKPGFVAAAIVILALGVGANAAIFTVAHAVLVEPLPVHDSEQVVSIVTEPYRNAPFTTSAYSMYRSQSQTLSRLAAQSLTQAGMGGGAQPAERVQASIVTENYFSVLGVPAVIGRTFVPDDNAVTVLAHSLWRTRFASSPGVVGRTVAINGNPFTVIGVADPQFRGVKPGIPVDLWVPIAAAEAMDDGFVRSPRTAWLEVIGRLAPEVSVEQAQSELASVPVSQLVAINPNRPVPSLKLVPINVAWMSPAQRKEIERSLILLLSAAGFVLMIAFANVSNLLLVRGVIRRKEIAIRAAIGANRWALIRQLLAESLLLSLAAGQVGILIAAWTVDYLASFRLAGLALERLNLGMGWRVALFTMGLSIVIGVTFGLLPALRISKVPLMSALRESSVGALDSRSSRLRSSLAVAQLALAVILLIGAVLFLRSLDKGLSLSLGFESDRVLTARADLYLLRYTSSQGLGFQRRLLERVRSMTSVESAALSLHTPLYPATMVAEAMSSKEFIAYSSISPRYFATMKIPLLRGRDFTEADDESAPPVAIVTESFARQFWPGEEALGKRISAQLGGGVKYMEVVGVAADGRYTSLREAPKPFFFVSSNQNYVAQANLSVRTASDPMRIASALRREVFALDANLPLMNVAPLDDQVRAALAQERLGANLFGVFGTLALVLAATGVFAVVSFSTYQRMREFGIRIALGADRMAVWKMVLQHGARLAVPGILIGVGGALALTHYISSMLFGVTPTDPASFISVCGILLLAVLLGCIVPAWRATRVDPVVVLRSEI